jgi:assimilatory nitrate reductase catalytic subunit
MRFAAYDGECLTGMVFIAKEPVAVSREWAISLLSGDVAACRRSAVLAGRPGAGVFDRGAMVCACFGIGANEIAAAVTDGCSSVADVGMATQAGMNCGSCRPEIKRIIHEKLFAKAV